MKNITPTVRSCEHIMFIYYKVYCQCLIVLDVSPDIVKNLKIYPRLPTLLEVSWTAPVR